MRIVLQSISWIALAATIAPSLLFLAGAIELKQVHTLMLAATAVWFAATPLWMGRRPAATAESPAEPD